MITINRTDLKTYFPELIERIQEHHNMENIYEELFVRNKPVRGLCHTRSYFVIMDGDIFVQYTMEHTIVEPQLYIIARTLCHAILYDNYQEYECDRIRCMSRVAPTDQNGLNLN